MEDEIILSIPLKKLQRVIANKDFTELENLVSKTLEKTIRKRESKKNKVEVRLNQEKLYNKQKAEE